MQGHASEFSLFCPSVKWSSRAGGVIFVNNHSMEHFNKTDFSTEMVLNLLFASLFLMFCSLVNLLLAKIIARGHNKVAESIPKDEKA